MTPLFLKTTSGGKLQFSSFFSIRDSFLAKVLEKKTIMRNSELSSQKNKYISKKKIGKRIAIKNEKFQ